MTPDVSSHCVSVGFIVGGVAQLETGTSIAAPFWAGLIAAAGPKLGFITPKLYQNPTAFNDITTGDNGGFFAAVGVDPVSGLGSPNGTAIISLLKKGNPMSVPTPAQVAAFVAAYEVVRPVSDAFLATPEYQAWAAAKATFDAILNAPSAPVITGGLTASDTAGAAFSYTITASNTPTSFSATGLPAGLAIDPATGVISGTPTAAGTSNVVLGATNAGGTGNATLVLTVNPAAAPTSFTDATGVVWTFGPPNSGQWEMFMGTAQAPSLGTKLALVNGVAYSFQSFSTWFYWNGSTWVYYAPVAPSPISVLIVAS